MSLSTPCTYNQYYTSAQIGFQPSVHPPTYTIYIHTHRESKTGQWLISLQTLFCWRGMRVVGLCVTSVHLFPLKWAAMRSEPTTLAWNSGWQKQQNKAAGSQAPSTHHTLCLVPCYATTWLENINSTLTNGCAGFHTPQYTDTPHNATCKHTGKGSTWSVWIEEWRRQIAI